MSLARIPTWRVALHETIEAHRRLPFAWGQHDCALFVADCVRAMTGLDLATGFRGSYSTPAGSVRALKRAGFDDLVALAANFFEAIPPMMARAGDIAAIETPDGWAVGVVVGEQVLFLGSDGLGAVDRLSTTKAFKVP